jgi:histidinol-phosphatase
VASGIRVSQVDRLEDASFCYSSLPEWEQIGRLEPMLDLMRDTWRSRAFGDFYGYMLLAEGALDIMVELQLSVWDLAALVPIVLEAGGEFTDIAGTPGPNGGNAIATNGKLHAEVLRRVGTR